MEEDKPLSSKFLYSVCMGILYIVIAIIIVAYSLLDGQIPDNTIYILAGILFFYGVFKIWNGYKKKEK
ncbi:MAG TPA: hypothetical protein PKW49_10940 [Paludibacteraceae bacterium]|jgi:uncharacterized membrane protein HdeD (DUF308 family)|nr:hypothetical protein [Paludibacteraceae bacterium]